MCEPFSPGNREKYRENCCFRRENYTGDSCNYLRTPDFCSEKSFFSRNGTGLYQGHIRETMCLCMELTGRASSLKPVVRKLSSESRKRAAQARVFLGFFRPIFRPPFQRVFSLAFGLARTCLADHLILPLGYEKWGGTAVIHTALEVTPVFENSLYEHSPQVHRIWH